MHSWSSYSTSSSPKHWCSEQKGIRHQVASSAYPNPKQVKFQASSWHATLCKQGKDGVVDEETERSTWRNENPGYEMQSHNWSYLQKEQWSNESLKHCWIIWRRTLVEIMCFGILWNGFLYIHMFKKMVCRSTGKILFCAFWSSVFLCQWIHFYNLLVYDI